MYLLLILHGIHYYNPAFWKWFLPAAIIFALERVYRHVVVRRHKVLLKCAGAYDDVSRVAIVEMEKPKGFRYEPGQHVMLNLPWIGKIYVYIHTYIHTYTHIHTHIHTYIKQYIQQYIHTYRAFYTVLIWYRLTNYLY